MRKIIRRIYMFLKIIFLKVEKDVVLYPDARDEYGNIIVES